jgi:hypothetical protein
MSKWVMGAHFKHLCFNSFSNDIKNFLNRWVLTLAIALWRFGSPFGIPTPTMGVHLRVWGFIPSHSLHYLHSREHVMWLLSLPIGPQPCNPLALVASPRLGLQHHLGMWGVHSLTLSYTVGNMKCDSRASLLACTFVSPCLSHKPKARVTTCLGWNRTTNGGGEGGGKGGGTLGTFMTCM